MFLVSFTLSFIFSISFLNFGVYCFAFSLNATFLRTSSSSFDNPGGILGSFPSSNSFRYLIIAFTRTPSSFPLAFVKNKPRASVAKCNGLFEILKVLASLDNFYFRITLLS
ncbi:110aa long hypothetical protein [Pyrococcus horikoshii OT3]|uniref:Uncharacterized protein n=1 Tax=Pyrococcus horikoshii (strain ATCC 700860 / DSM 12428 / JCM 9974 / NBRC 100139 / OT-3) TaxID=70601 RepID=O58195_PYRHO|nr:110aa long hypothetical protein [Pyrococcus horikoshii OT3]